MASRYRTGIDEVDQLLADLAQLASRPEDEPLLEEMLVSVVRMANEGLLDRGELKLVNTALKEMRYAFGLFEPYKARRKATIFGSARTKPDEPAYAAARDFGAAMVEHDWMVMTGAGPGIMQAGLEGAGRDSAFGINIVLPFESEAPEIIADDPKLINFRYFFTRKLTFVKEAHAIALFPGGFGTHDEACEALTLIQTGKGEMLPVVFVDAPGGSYWRDWLAYVRTHMGGGGFISPQDLDLFKVTDDLDEAVHEILKFYSNYHSSRFVGDRFVLRVRRAPDAETLDSLNADFKDIVTEGAIELAEALPGEAGEATGLSRVSLRFNRRDRGRLRQLIDRLNSLVADEASAPGDASPHEIIPGDLPDDAFEERDS
jgi:uncharacterized protein (TIGR00730 family)